MQWSSNDVRTAPISAVTTQAAVCPDPGNGKRIIVLGYVLTVDAAGEVQFHSGAATALTGLMEVVADTPLQDSSDLGVLVGAPSEAVYLTATTAANGYVRYAIAQV